MARGPSRAAALSSTTLRLVATARRLSSDQQTAPTPAGRLAKFVQVAGCGGSAAGSSSTVML